MAGPSVNLRPDRLDSLMTLSEDEYVKTICPSAVLQCCLVRIYTIQSYATLHIEMRQTITQAASLCEPLWVRLAR